MGLDIWMVQHVDIGIKRNEEFNSWIMKHFRHSDLSSNYDISYEDILEAISEDPGAMKKFEKELRQLMEAVKTFGCDESIEINLS